MTQILTLSRELQTALNLGEYTLQATQSLVVGGSQETFTVQRTFLVAGPRFMLESDQITSTFPPPNTNGDYNNFLPNITLRRATLPWERKITSTSDRPFLALLMVSATELAEGVRVKSQRIVDFCNARTMTLERSDDPEAHIQVVEADGTLLKSLLPSFGDIELLAHVRQRGSEPQEAVILGNRRPLPNTRYTVYLVSLEGLNPDTLTAGTVRLPSLYSWEFTCGVDKIGLVERLMELHCDGLRLPELAGASGSAYQALRRDGYAAMPYSLAWGDRTHGLYRGPLLPVSIPEDLSVSNARAAGLDSSEGLVDYFSNMGLSDVSLAAAWELGRMLMLRRRDVAMSYYRFRREQAGLAYQEANAAAEQHLVLQDIPIAQAGTPPSDVCAFCHELIDLRGIPFPYLVPDPRMLPATSLRVFRIDRRWLACLLGGSLSLGRSRAVDRARESVYLNSLLSTFEDRSGVLIRGPVVSERPDQTYVLTNDAGTVQPILRRERLAPDVLLIVVKGVLKKIEASEEPQAAHFGFKERGGSGAEYFEKDLRDPSTFQELQTTIRLESHYRTAHRDVINVSALAADFAANSSLIQAQGHHFALQLIESGAGAISIPLGGA